MIKRCFFTFFLFLWAAAAVAQGLEIITLRHRTAEQVMPELRPMLAPGAALTGRGDSLFLRTTPANAEEIRQVLAMLDRPLRRLMISVRHAGQQAGQGGSVTLSGEVGRRTVISGSVTESRSVRGDNIAQQVQTVEGGRAHINVGQSSPLVMRQVVPTPRGPVVSETLAYRETGTGFYVEPRLAGDRVTLAISVANDAPGALPGSAEVRRVVSTVSGRLGEWMPLGGSTQQSARSGYGVAANVDDRQVWLMVEEIP
jgi:type II secretory pathway component GspD/PulD (secretin)